MDIPRGHALLPLTLLDLQDFLSNYIKSEYAPLRSIFSTATAVPRQYTRWANMGHEFAPLVGRPAHAQAQKDIEGLDRIVREKGLDAWFIRGLVVRFAKFDGFERLDRSLFEAGRGDLLVRKALKERHMIDVLWPSPPPRGTDKDVLQQGVRVRNWYGDMFTKYFQYLRAVDDFKFRDEIDERIKRVGQLNLVPGVEFLVFGDIGPIKPIVGQGVGFNYSQRGIRAGGRGGDRTTIANTDGTGSGAIGKGYGEPDRFEIRLDTPTAVEETRTKTVMRQTECLKCGTRRDVTVSISIDPVPGKPAATGTQLPNPKPNTSARTRQPRTEQRHAPPGNWESNATSSDSTPSGDGQSRDHETSSPAPPAKHKQCPRCTFLNHPDLTQCEMCNADLPEEAVDTPPSPPRPSAESAKPKGPAHAQSKSLPENQSKGSGASRPELKQAVTNRHSLTSTLFSMMPFSGVVAHAVGMGQQPQEQPKAKPESHQAKEETAPPRKSTDTEATKPSESSSRPPTSGVDKSSNHKDNGKAKEQPASTSSHSPPNNNDDGPDPWATPPTRPSGSPDKETRSSTPDPILDQPPIMAIMPLTPLEDPTQYRDLRGLPRDLMDDYVPPSPGFQDEEDEDKPGWGELSEERRNEVAKSDEDEDDSDKAEEAVEEAGWGEVRKDRSDDTDEGTRESSTERERRYAPELDDVGREEMGIWGDR